MSENDYVDDIELTRILMEESDRRKKIEEDIINGVENKESKGASEFLGEKFAEITEKMHKRGNFRGYSDNYKCEFVSNAYLFFCRYWWKFDPEKVKNNWEYETIVDDNGKKTKVKTKLKPREEWKGAFTYFTTLAWSGTIGSLKTLKEQDSKRKKLAEKMTSDSSSDINTEFFIGRSFVEGY